MTKCPNCAADLVDADAPCGRCRRRVPAAPSRLIRAAATSRPLLWTLLTSALVALSIPIGSLIGPTRDNTARDEQRRAIYNGLLLGESSDDLASRYQTTIEEIDTVRAEGLRKGWKLEDVRPKSVAEKVVANRNAIVRQFERSGLLVTRTCVSHEAHVQPEGWLALDFDARRNVASILADWCAAQGTSSRMTIVDAVSGRTLAEISNGNYSVSE
jgi:hypothetical protein